MPASRLDRTRFDDVVAVLRAAFRDYPVLGRATTADGGLASWTLFRPDA